MRGVEHKEWRPLGPKYLRSLHPNTYAETLVTYDSIRRCGLSEEVRFRRVEGPDCKVRRVEAP